MKNVSVGILHTFLHTDTHPDCSKTLHRFTRTPCLYPLFWLLLPTSPSNAFAGTMCSSSSSSSLPFAASSYFSGTSFTSAAPTSHGKSIGVTNAACRFANQSGNSLKNVPNARPALCGTNDSITARPNIRCSSSLLLFWTARTHLSATSRLKSIFIVIVSSSSSSSFMNRAKRLAKSDASRSSRNDEINNDVLLLFSVSLSCVGFGVIHALVSFKGRRSPPPFALPSSSPTPHHQKPFLLRDVGGESARRRRRLLLNVVQHQHPSKTSSVFVLLLLLPFAEEEDKEETEVIVVVIIERD